MGQREVLTVHAFSVLSCSHDGNRVKLPGYLALVQNLPGTDIACVSIITGKQFSL